MNVRNTLINTAIDAVMTKAEEMRTATPSNAQTILKEAYQLPADLGRMETDEAFDIFDPKHLA